jgi:phosphoribosylamine---glycine ligase
MRALVIGSGGREHALVWALARERRHIVTFCSPGNPGIAEIAECLPYSSHHLEDAAASAARCAADITVVGPEAPLAAGLADLFSARHLVVVGPDRRAARLESSKAFMKNLCARYGIPTAPFRIFDHAGDAIAFIRQAGRPLVIKADGLASGKGVVVAETADAGVAAVEMMMVGRRFGAAGARVVVEEVLEGEELSLLAVSDGTAVVPLIPVRDHKRLLDGDHGPNTGGMGAYAPVPEVSRGLVDRITDEILEPAIWAMAQDGCPYRGVLFAGLMLTPDGPRVLEFNVRFGDPETQVLLPLLASDLSPVFEAVLTGGVDRLALRWHDRYAVCVVLCSAGYPEAPSAPGTLPRPRISGLETAAALDGIVIFHAGTARENGHVVAAGGRVLNVVGCGETLEEAARRAYHGADLIAFEGKTFRRDIGVGRSPAGGVSPAPPVRAARVPVGRSGSTP